MKYRINTKINSCDIPNDRLAELRALLLQNLYIINEKQYYSLFPSFIENPSYMV